MSIKPAYRQAANVHMQLLSRFIWLSDRDNFGQDDKWVNLLPELDKGRTIYGDCDDFAMTAARLLLRAGFRPDQIRLCLCWVETGDYHMVCAVDLEAGSFVIDNRQRRIMPWHRLPYRWHLSMRVSERGTWRKIPTREK